MKTAERKWVTVLGMAMETSSPGSGDCIGACSMASRTHYLHFYGRMRTLGLEMAVDVCQGDVLLG